MSFGILWKYQTPDGLRVITGHPGAFAENREEAKADGNRMLTDLPGVEIDPLYIVEMRQELCDQITAECEELELGPNDEFFYDVSELGSWKKYPWWPL